MFPNRLFTPEYLDLCLQFEDFKRSPQRCLIDGSSYIHVSNYANYCFCPFSLRQEQDKLEPLVILTQEEKDEQERSRQAAMAYGAQVHRERAVRITKETPNTTVSTGSLGPKPLARREEIKRIVAPIIQKQIQWIQQQHPGRPITLEMIEKLESEAISQAPTISKEDEVVVKEATKVERVLATKPIAGAQELNLVLIYKGIWFSGRMDGVFFMDGKISRVDEFKTSIRIERARAYVAQSELYCLMLSRATGQKDFPYTLSLGKATPKLFPINILGEWDGSEVLKKLDTAVDYFTGKVEVILPETFWVGMCDGCYCISACPIREKLRREGSLAAQKRFKEYQEEVGGRR